MLDVVIIGSGPAGLSAAIYAKRAGLDAVVLEQAPFSGGQMQNAHIIDNYAGLPGITGPELAQKMRDHAQQLGARFVTAQVTEAGLSGPVKKIIADEETYEAANVVIATGTEYARLGIPGEERLTGAGVSYCATCDGAFFRNKTAAVIGGGDVAAGDAAYLARICKKVFLIHRRDKLRAAKSLQDEVMRQSNVEIVWNTVVSEIVGAQRVEALQVRHTVSGKTGQISVQGAFIAVGTRPRTQLFAAQVKTDEFGYLIAGEDGRTSLEGVYAAGDVRSGHMRQIITAAADGANCIESIVNGRKEEKERKS